MGKVGLVKRDLIERYRGRWVAVDESGNVVADADELGSLLERLADLELHADTIQRVQPPSTPSNAIDGCAGLGILGTGAVFWSKSQPRAEQWQTNYFPASGELNKQFSLS